MKSVHDVDPIFRMANSFVNQTSCNVFLTGKAGSGKTTFLHYINRNTSKKMVVVAPTGVAAINAGGMTIHSFFQLPIGMFVPETKWSGFLDFENAVYSHGALLKKVRINRQKRKLLQQLELLIIDEVSMVRADVMDAMDVVLKHIRKNYRQPFGGVQVLMIGDLYQLPPVVTDQDKTMLFRYYESPYFFSAKVIRESPPVRLELQKVYRQHEKEFIGLLNKVRHNQISEEDLKLLNNYFDPDFKPCPSERYITLCSHHYKANAINDSELNQLPGKMYRFEAEIEGEFNDSAAPADPTLFLKKGTQIMFIKNDTGEEKRYYNGKIGMISEIDGEEIQVVFPGEERIIFLEKEVWKNIRYTLDESTDRIIEKELGSFSQYPIRLAWAITIHKSQGLTFDRAIIDAGDSFASGQVYVALSRLRDTRGLVLRTPIEKRSIINDWQFDQGHKPQNAEELMGFLQEEQKNFLQKILLKSMDWDPLIYLFSEFIEEYREKQVSYRDEALGLVNNCLNKTKELREVAGRFQAQVRKLYAEGGKNYQVLSERMQASFEYFNRHLREGIRDPLTIHYEQMKSKPRIRKYLAVLQGLRQAEIRRMQEIRQARDLAAGLAKGKKIESLLDLFNSQRKQFMPEPEEIVQVPKSRKGDSQNLSFELYRQGKTVNEIARERMLQPGTIESHLLQFIRKGELEVYALITEEKYGKLVSKINSKTFGSVSEIKYEMGDQYSFNEIRAVLGHLDYIKKNIDKI